MDKVDDERSVFFLWGRDPRRLSEQQAKQVYDLVLKSQVSSSFMIYNQLEASRKMRLCKQTFPWIKPHFAIKTGPCQFMIADALKHGCGFDCASKTQIQRVFQLGGKPQSIIYSNTIKEESDLAWAAENGVRLTTADSICELVKIKKYAPSMDILWRIAVEQQPSSQEALPDKFGDYLDTPARIHQRMKEIQAMDIRLKGIHFHCGMCNNVIDSFVRCVTVARQCIKIGRQYGHTMDLLDIGGGFSREELTPQVIKAVSMTKDDPLGYEVVSEPGRHFCANAMYLVMRVIGTAVKNNRICVYVNESQYHSFRCDTITCYLQRQGSKFYAVEGPNDKQRIGETNKSTIFGMTCDWTQVLIENILTPKQLKVGDWLCCGGMGAYTFGCSGSFNGMKAADHFIRWSANIEQPQAAELPALANSAV